MYITLTLVAYLIDRVFGEFKYNDYIKHPVVYMGDFIKWYEKHFYKNDIKSGVFLTLSLVSVVFSIVYLLSLVITNEYILAIFASTGIASKMLYDSVKDIIQNPQNIKYLVSRDTKELTPSEINKAAIETYGENFSDGIVAPLFYLFCFGIVGLFVYKSINTLDSMVGYRNARYEKFGKCSALLDDVVNYIPARLTAILIILLFGKIDLFSKVFHYGKLHESPNAGYPISAMGFCVGVKLGGDTSYFGKIKHKANFSEGKIDISKEDIENSLKLRVRFDIFIVLILVLLQIIL
ncbi:MAG: adenosylcobinamide-phosphate synthase CbiB [Arcobacteraceae bacterium]